VGLSSDDIRTHSAETGISLKHVVQISCGAYHTACIADPGLLYTWGRRECLGRIVEVTVPADGPVSSKNARNGVNGGAASTKGSTRTEQIHLASKAVGLFAGDSCEPDQLPFFKGKRIQFVCCGESHITVKCYTELYAWGLNGYGQLGEYTLPVCIYSSLLIFLANNICAMLAKRVSIIYQGMVHAHPVCCRR
jgi:alpha-tubulin suppressor-like RCC1 family protein